MKMNVLRLDSGSQAIRGSVDCGLTRGNEARSGRYPISLSLEPVTSSKLTKAFATCDSYPLDTLSGA
jgi:hypothetical protein